ncbi:MAG: vitamin K epoxide reductase family protein [Chroococcidiopsidaceae cyanobacterium CP_BM_ER_R8_30]|nr:vitamin K epoxide reductase family protein [Chroococcidiopsidaceae cyanobacterium CP_BM_ER_R8_30]
MSRQPTIPWMHRWSRLLIAATAGLGALTTAYLTVVKLTQSTAACPTAGCNTVLNSDYATVLGQPLALFGFLAYTGMVIFALTPLAISKEEKPELYSTLENWTWSLLLVGAIAMSVFSGYLVYLLTFKIQAACLYCIASALFSLSLLVLTIIGRAWEDVGQIVFTSIVVGVVVLVGTLGIYAVKPTAAMAELPPESAALSLLPFGQPIPGIGWSITTTSGKAEIALAKHLQKIGAKEYIAWWCPHCHEQKQLFGKEAYREINSIDCASSGVSPRPECQAAHVESYPTWEINGKSYEGVQSLDQLAEISGYTGPRDFKNFSGAF